MTDKAAMIARVTAAIMADPSHAWTRESMARVIHVHPSYLDKLCLSVTGLYPGALVRSIRLREAMRLLATTDLAVAAIAAHVGYAAVGTFSDALVRAIGMRPGTYRARHGRGQS